MVEQKSLHRRINHRARFHRNVRTSTRSTESRRRRKNRAVMLYRRLVRSRSRKARQAQCRRRWTVQISLDRRFYGFHTSTGHRREAVWVWGLAHLSLTGGGMLKAGNSFALGLSNSIAIVLFTARASCTRPLSSTGGRTLTARPPRAVTSQCRGPLAPSPLHSLRAREGRRESLQ